ncbi:MAG: T9SS type A sorting domain-containing protein [Bacteroidetes bacterium]|nr:T9SS type A sorting domain-containing protein [Bacteroidota bacterium]
MKKLFIKFTGILIFLSMNIGILSAQQLTLTQKNGCLNDTLFVPINYSSIDSVAAITLYITFDTAVLTYAGFANTDLLTPGLMCGVPTGGPNAWQLVVTWVDYTTVGVNLTSGKLCDIKFVYKGGSTNLNFLTSSELVKASLAPIIPAYTSGSIAPTILTHPSATQICENAQTAFTLTAAAGSTFQWQVQNGTQWDNIQNNTTYSGATTNSLHLLNALYNLNAKVYRCQVTKTCTQNSNTALLTVYPRPVVITNNDTTICSGNAVIVNATGTTGTGTLLYSWDNGAGLGIAHSVSPTNNTIYHVTVTDANSCSSTDSVIVNVNQLPSTPGSITGSATVCQGQNSVTYSVPAVSYATSYTWTLPTGATGSSTSNTITVNYSTSAVSGNITIRGVNTCGNGATSTLPVTVNPLPAAAGNISGLTTVCQGQSAVSYTIAAITNATAYTWTLPTGASGTSTSNTISISYSTSAVSGNVKVKASNACGVRDSASLAVTVNPLVGTPGTMSGLATVCQGQSAVIYTIPAITNALSYVWTLPTGASGSSTTNTISVNYSANAVSGKVVVKGSNLCGIGDSSFVAVTVNPLPSAAGTISGSATVCQGQSAVSYTIPAITNATAYTWTLPTGATGTSTTNTITVNYSTTALSGNLKVKASNTCGVRDSATLAITVNPLPVAAGTITGSATVCQGQSSVVYSVPTITNATSYVWTLPTGATGTSTTNTITVNYSTTALSGKIVVKGSNSCGVGDTSFLSITVNPVPLAAGTVSGLSTVCQGQTAVTYSVAAITNATSYAWTLPTGATGTSTTNTITVNYTVNAVTGKVVVKGNNSCGLGDSSFVAVTVNPLPSAAGVITGLTSICQGQSNVIYTIPAITNANTYTWTLPTGCSGTSTTNTITVSYSTSAISGNIRVKASNACGVRDSSLISVTVNALVAAAGTITGSATVCQGQSAVVYSVPAIANATTYLWTLPTGATGTSTINTISVNYSTTAISGKVVVKGNNACGTGDSSYVVVTVNPLPVVAGTISGTSTVCQGQTLVSYSVPAITNATSYVWTLPAGATGTSTSNTITVNYTVNAVSGKVVVRGSNSCGVGDTSFLAITVNPLPSAAGTITGLSSVCLGQSNVVYTIPVIANASTYTWTLPTGASGTSTSNTISVNYSLTAVSGNIRVKASNACGVRDSSTLAVTVNQIVGAAGTISGLTTVCQGQSAVSYSVPAITNATSYLWTLPTGATGTSTSNTISVNYTNTAISGKVVVKGNNACGTGDSAFLVITVNPLPVIAGTISGTATVCQGQSAVSYTVPAITNATSYNWKLPTGATGTSTTNTISVNFTNTAVSGKIVVKGVNACGAGDTSFIAITVNPLPAAAGVITGLATVCQGQSAVSYTVPVIANATSYIWTLPTGASGTSTTNTIAVSYSTTAVSGKIVVKGSNACGLGDTSFIAITVNPLPGPAGTITSNGNDTVNYNENNALYTVPVIANATSYIWSYTGSGITFVPSATTTTDSVRINFGAAATSGDLTVKGHNACGDGVVSAVYHIYVTVGINEIVNNLNYRIYPNPSKGNVTLEIDAHSDKIELSIYSLQGEMIYKEDINNKHKMITKELDLSKYTKGIYFVKIRSNGYARTEKLIIQ